MVRSDFVEYVDSWSDLMDFCYEYSLDTMKNVYDSDRLDDYIDDHLPELAREYTWRELYDILSSIPDGNCFLCESYTGIIALNYDDDFARYKSWVLEEADEYDVFDDEEYDEDSIGTTCPEAKAEFVDPDLVYEIGQEDVSIEELLALAV